MAKPNTQTKAAAPAAAEKSGPQVTHLQVTSRKDGFYRSGRRWSTSPVTVPVADFTTNEIEQLLAEPMLTVVPVAEGGE